MKHHVMAVSLVLALAALAPAPASADAGGLAPYERAAELAPQDPQAQFNLGVVSLKAGNFAEAAGALKKATALSPNDAEAWEAYGVALSQLGSLADAAAALRNSTRLDPRGVGAWSRLGQVLAEEGSPQDLAAAADAYGEADRIKPDDPRAALNEGMLLARLGRTPEAEQILLRVSGMPGGQAALGVLCALYDKTGDYARAEDVCRRAAQADGKAESWYNLGFALQQGGQMDAARQAYQQALQADPSHASSLYALASLDFQAGDATAALSGFLAALKSRQGNYPAAAYNAAILLGDQGDYEQAADLYRKFLETHPDDATAQANLRSVVEQGIGALLLKGQDAYERGDFDAAREAWTRARRLDPENGEASRMLKLAAGGGAGVSLARAASAAAGSAVASRLADEDARLKRRGMEAFRAGHDAEAAHLLGFYVRNHPGDGDAARTLVEARGRVRADVDELLRKASDAMASGDRVRAGSLASRALEQDPGNARARLLQRQAGSASAPKADPEAVRKLYYAGVDQYLAGDLKGASGTWTRVLKMQPDDLDAQRSLERAQMELQALRRLGKG